MLTPGKFQEKALYGKGYLKASALGHQGECEVMDYLQHKYSNFEITPIVDEKSQKLYGDFYWNVGGNQLSVDVKTEKEDKYGNFFFEYWSNKESNVPGWCVDLEADLLAYYFLEDKKLYLINFKAFKEWAYIKKQVFKFPLRKQSKYNQRNDSWGHCVPIKFCKECADLKVVEFLVS